MIDRNTGPSGIGPAEGSPHIELSTVHLRSHAVEDAGSWREGAQVVHRFHRASRTYAGTCPQTARHAEGTHL